MTLTQTRIAVIAAVTAVTLGIHYGWLIEPIFGHVHWLHAIHGRFCYIPIMIAAAWFGLRGGLITATAISIAVMPLVVNAVTVTHDFAAEIAEVVFYYAIAVLIGLLVDREYRQRRQKEAAQQQVERSQKLSLVGQVAAGVAHEIKNPLASIKGAADILTDDNASVAEKEEFKEILRSEVRRIDTTVDEFLEFARPREAKLESMDLGESVRQTARQVEAQAGRDNVTFELDVAEAIIVRGDAQKLHQLTLNLLLNSMQALPDGGEVKVVVGSHGRLGEIFIIDKGAGMEPHELERIFEPFFTTRASGTGLGLAVVRTIVDAHRGGIEVNSVKGQGTTVHVTVPVDTGGAPA